VHLVGFLFIVVIADARNNEPEKKNYLLDVSTIIAFSIENESVGSPAMFQLWILMSDPRTFWKLNFGEQGTLSSVM
jgi:hypothetical protein